MNGPEPQQSLLLNSSFVRSCSNANVSSLTHNSSSSKR